MARHLSVAGTHKSAQLTQCWSPVGGIIVCYDLLDPNLEITSVGKEDAYLPVLDDEGAEVPGLFMVTSSMVSPGGYSEWRKDSSAFQVI